MSTLVCLVQVANHPLLVRRHFDNAALEQIITLSYRRQVSPQGPASQGPLAPGLFLFQLSSS